MADTSSPLAGPTMCRTRLERIQATAQKHWMGRGATPEQQATSDEIRRQYYVTAQEYHRSAHALYESLHVQMKRAAAHKAPFALPNRNVQLFLAYSILWEAFNHVYTAASYTHFAAEGPGRADVEDERTKIDRVLDPPILSDADLSKITVLKNGETVNHALSRMVNRSSRELKEIYGKTDVHTLTNMDAFLQGVVAVTEVQDATGQWQRQTENENWTVQALNAHGEPINGDDPWSPEKYRSVIRWHCYQIRTNLNFVGTSDGSIDDAILIIRAFCLVDPIVAMLLQPGRKTSIFAL